ncbi:MAG TPA: flagellar basal body L-ring protein [Rhodospirillaceae bacterium]|jgi:flagellar L-ring protein precursor FlgH|nr:flagellar basal body L-ring protein FlgH [Alphaproteobacteria bacterium]HBH26554.1 flagellar basal body L-ring protein [Rhodospirillaceae bacterium]
MRALLILPLVLALVACTSTAEKIKNIGKPPPITPIENPVQRPNYRPVTMPMPTPSYAAREKNSLWASGRSTFFKDQRASNVGDILTVLIDIKDEATLDNKTERTRTSDDNAGFESFLGLETQVGKVLPDAVDPASLIGFGSTSTTAGDGSVEREEDIKLKMAALITQILPNGNMVIHGRQEVLVNFEKRVLEIDGVIRPEDISTGNTISYEQIAEARIVYGGQGHITDIQQPRYGQQLYDIVFPF